MLARLSRRSGASLALWAGVLASLLALSACQKGGASDGAAASASGASSAASSPAVAAAASAVPPALDGIALAAPDAAAVRQPSSPQAWGGPRSGQEPTLSDRVVDYQIEARLDPEAHTIEGKQRLSWRNRSAVPVRSVYLHLYLNAFEGEGSTFMSEQRRLGFAFRSDVPIKKGDWGYIELKKVQQAGVAVPWYFVQPDGGPATDRTVVRLDLPQAVAPGGSTTLDIDFFDQLPRVLARTGYFGSFHLVGQWFPKIAVLELPGERGATAPRWNAHEFHLHSEFYADFGRYEVRIDVPEGYTVGATGELQGEPKKQGGRVIHHYVQGDVHDFAWTADKRFAPPLKAVYEGEGSPKVQVQVLYPPEYAHNAPVVLKATLDALAWFSKTLGPYPYRTVTAVVPPFNAKEAGGMEYPTFFTADSYADQTPGTLAHFGQEFVTIHEFGHGYFYGILASNEFEEPFLDEGLNEFWDQRMIQARGQRAPVTTAALKRLGVGTTVDVFEGERLGAGLKDPPDGLGQNSWHRHSSGSYGTVYSRTATALRDLEAQIGREKLELAFKTYYQRWKFRHPSTADLREVLAEVSGQPALVQRLFEQHIYASRSVDDRVESFKSVEELPLLGLQIGPDGRRSELDKDAQEDLVEKLRAQWKKDHPASSSKAEAKKDPQTGEVLAEPGPFPYRTTVVLRRRGAAVPQTLRVRFADGSVETVRWDDQQSWARFSWVKPVKAVSAELDPERLHYLDQNQLDNSRALKSDGRAARRIASDAGSLLQTLLALVATL